MKKKLLWAVICSIIAISMLLSSCGGDEEKTVDEKTVTEETVTEKTVTEGPVTEEPLPTGGDNWWDAYGWGEPEYGGTLTYSTTANRNNWEMYYGGGPGWIYETMAMRNFSGVSREEYAFPGRFTPLKYYVGRLVESWEIPQWDTYIFHVRQGVKWQDKPPLNGREFDAYDIEYHFNRFIGLEGNPGSRYKSMYSETKEVTATDKWTVVFKQNEPSLYALRQFLDDHPNGQIVSRDVVEMYGDANEWTRCIGTGPFMVEDWVEASALTMAKSPNYWAYDERFPENQLPYVDKIKLLIIPDSATSRAALRTGKLDRMPGLTWEHRDKLLEENSNLVVWPYETQGGGIWMKLDRAPYNDIRVRKAMQMSIDIETIAATHYGGTVPGTPPGYTQHAGYAWPYEEWPQDIKDGYTYNPEGAKALLAEAGYPDGFKCTFHTSSSSDLDLAQIIKYYFSEIGIEMEISVLEPTVFSDYDRSGKTELAFSIGSNNFPPTNGMQFMTPIHRYYARHQNSGPIYDEYVAKYEAMAASFNELEQQQLGQECDKMIISNFWITTITRKYTYALWQPWVKGYAGEDVTGSDGQIFARVWLDLDMKAELGY